MSMELVAGVVGKVMVEPVKEVVEEERERAETRERRERQRRRNFMGCNYEVLEGGVYMGRGYK